MSKLKLTPEQLEEKYKRKVAQFIRDIQYIKDELKTLRERNDYLCKNFASVNHLTILSADNDYVIGQPSDWLRIVCNKDSNGLYYGVRNHWRSKWSIREDGFHLQEFVDQDYKGWHGQYVKSELRYDELPKEILALHHKALCEHTTKLGIWYPCHIYNDFTGELYRP